MYRIAIIAAAASLAILPARAQSLEGSIWSGVASGISGSFQTGFQGSLNSGFGIPSARSRRAGDEDFTLGAGAGFNRGFLRGQPSNFAPSVQSMTSIPDPTLSLGRGPETEVDLGTGPEGPLD